MALTILSVALIPIMAWVPTSIQTRLQTERKTTAIFLAQSKVEELHYKVINNFTTNYSEGPLPFNSPYQNFSYTITDNVDSSLKTISARVWHIEKPNDATAFYTQIAKR